MKLMPEKHVIENCGCCEGLNVLTPLEIFNRPGLEAIVYRAGAHGHFLETMKARLSSSDFPRLAGLTTRAGGDASIALLDAWATVADTLTFYQERIANEGYLRAATERRSILELARLIGYRLTPGVAASVYLAYTIELTQEKTTIEPGNRAQSIPGPGELPQVFETAERLEAYSNLNLMNARQRCSCAHIHAGFCRAEVLSRRGSQTRAGTQSNHRGAGAFCDDADAATVAFPFACGAAAAACNSSDRRKIYEYRRLRHYDEREDGRESDRAAAARLLRPSEQILSIQSGFIPQAIAAIHPIIGQFATAALKNFRSQAPATAPGIFFLGKVEAMRAKATLAGHNLPTIIEQRTVTNSNNVVTRTTTSMLSPPTLGEYLGALAQAGIPVSGGQGESLNAIALDAEYDQIKVGSTVAIARPETGSSGTFVTTHKVTNAEKKLVTFASIGSQNITFKVTVLTLDTGWLDASVKDSEANSQAIIRGTTVYVQGEELERTEQPVETSIGFAPNDPKPLVELDGFYSGLEPGRWVIISGERLIPDERQPGRLVNSGVVTSELLMVAVVTHEEKMMIDGKPAAVAGEKLHSFLQLAEAPKYAYKRDTVRIHGNVVRATHGETRNEILGSGDGSRKLQSFQLKQSPLTYLAAPTSSGTQSTLEVFVNDISWRESGNLFTLGRTDRRYITRADDEGKTTVVFGDGEHGARLPTGAENVRAVYRSGIGKAGNVSAEQIKLPLTRPLGVKDVINPTPASGGADRETRDQARRNAPIGTLALDRLVSVQDYADFARTFAGIGKASARRMSDGKRDIVHLTIAGAGDVLIDPASDLYRNLAAALKRFGDPAQPFDVGVFERILLVITAKVKIHSDYLWESVESKIRAALLDRFGFERRELGQDVPRSEALSVIQSVPGVDYVDLDLFDAVSEARLGDPSFSKDTLELRPRVNSELARLDSATNAIASAQLVFLSPLPKDTVILEEVAR